MLNSVANSTPPQEDMKNMPRVATFLKNIVNYHTTMPNEKDVEMSKKQPKVSQLIFLTHKCQVSSRKEGQKEKGTKNKEKSKFAFLITCLWSFREKCTRIMVSKFAGFIDPLTVADQ